MTSRLPCSRFRLHRARVGQSAPLPVVGGDDEDRDADTHLALERYVKILGGARDALQVHRGSVSSGQAPQQHECIA